MLVHCGAGVSRSAALVIAYLMRRFTWPAERAREHARARRSLVNPNQGFWRQLCAFEAELGITQRCAVLLRQSPVCHARCTAARLQFCIWVWS